MAIAAGIIFLSLGGISSFCNLTVSDMAQAVIELKAQLEVLQLQLQQARETAHLRAVIYEERRAAMPTHGEDPIQARLLFRKDQTPRPNLTAKKNISSFSHTNFGLIWLLTSATTRSWLPTSSIMVGYPSLTQESLRQTHAAAKLTAADGGL